VANAKKGVKLLVANFAGRTFRNSPADKLLDVFSKIK